MSPPLEPAARSTEVAEETLAAAVTATLSVVAAAADIEGRAPPMRHRFARRDNYTLVWSWA